MSQHPSRRPTNNESPFRPASPFISGVSPHLPHASHMPQLPQSSGRSRGPSTPIHHSMSPLTHPGMIQSLSPVSIGMPKSPGMSPVLGFRPPGFIQCPLPRWPSPVSSGNATARPYIPQTLMECRRIGPEPVIYRGPPLPCGPSEYLITPYQAGDYDYIGVPLEPIHSNNEDSGPSTAEIIASQSQDYVDEKLAEYQATIAFLQVI
ncbi:hypothetical protein PV327_004025 [Microctonus hyperodae]|uniref:Uncharacterized protein n=1 Tax=Microctonus hyperodae TaxID=165561 RepID=A0AA39G666_MICHY|nr:hypothetical protein PV327_004025 [Microctonus hyperodae]